MTGLDCLREELANRGLPKSQIESRGVAMTLDILSNSGDFYTKMQRDEKELSEKVKSLTREQNSLERSIEHYRKIEAGYRDREAQKRLEEVEYIKQFFAAVKTCETAEGRDAMKRAQIFINTVSVDTKYDNTAFIIGLSAILSDGNVGALSELKKINPLPFKGCNWLLVGSGGQNG